MERPINTKSFIQDIKNIVEPVNDPKKWFFFLIAVNFLFILKLHITVQNFLFQNLINNKVILIPYFLLAVCSYYFLFTSKFNAVLPEKRVVVILFILYLIIIALALTFLGNLTFIDQGSDNDDAIEVFIQSVFQGIYPYTQVTPQFENRLSPLPFEPFYSIPFFLLGNIAYQNIVNVGILITLIWLISGNDDQKIFGYLSISLCIPLYLYLVTQSDNITIVTFLLLIGFLLSRCRLFSGSVLTGCMIAAKGTFWLIVPAIIVYISKKTDLKTWIMYCCLISIVASVFIIPFLIWDANTFINYAPIPVIGQKNLLFGVEYSNYLLPACYCIVSLVCALKIRDIFFTTIIVYGIASITLFDYTAMIISFGIAVIGLSSYKNTTIPGANTFPTQTLCVKTGRKPEKSD
jgi:hypothetical protein